MGQKRKSTDLKAKWKLGDLISNEYSKSVGMVIKEGIFPWDSVLVLTVEKAELDERLLFLNFEGQSFGINLCLDEEEEWDFFKKMGAKDFPVDFNLSIDDFTLGSYHKELRKLTAQEGNKYLQKSPILKRVRRVLFLKII